MKERYLVDYIESPFSSIIARKEYILKVQSIATQKCNVSLNTPLSKKIGIELRTWKKFLNQECIESSTYHRLGEFCGFSREEIRNGIQNIDWIENPKIPLNFQCPAGVRLYCGIVNEGRTRSRAVEYVNKDRVVLDIIKNCAKEVLGNNFSPSERTDLRDQTVCLTFPPFFAKHFIKNGIEGNKNSLDIRIPDYILNNREYCKIWWQGNLSEEASIYPFASPSKNGKWYIVPRIQINRVKSVSFTHIFPKKEKTYYKRDIPSSILQELNQNILELITDEAIMLRKCGIKVKTCFSKLYFNKKGKQTATYSIILSNLEEVRRYYSQIGFELERHKQQCELLLNNRGPKTKEEIRKIIVQFYELVPPDLRGNKKINVNKWLTSEDRTKLIQK